MAQALPGSELVLRDVQPAPVLRRAAARLTKSRARAGRFVERSRRAGVQVCRCAGVEVVAHQGARSPRSGRRPATSSARSTFVRRFLAPPTRSLRAHFADGLVVHEAGSTVGTFRNLCFRETPGQPFFPTGRPGRKPVDPDDRRERRTLRKERNLRRGCARKRRRRLRLQDPAAGRQAAASPCGGTARRPGRAAAADRLSPRSFRTDFGGLFLFAHARISFDSAGMPGSGPAGCAPRSSSGADRHK